MVTPKSAPLLSPIVLLDKLPVQYVPEFAVYMQFGIVRDAAAFRDWWENHGREAFTRHMAHRKACACCGHHETVTGDAESRCQHCINLGMVRFRQGWRQLGVYDG